MWERGVPHDGWMGGENDIIVVQFACTGRQEHVKEHVFGRLNNAVNAYELLTRNGYDVPNPYHKHHCLLMLNGEVTGDTIVN